MLPIEVQKKIVAHLPVEVESHLHLRPREWSYLSKLVGLFVSCEPPNPLLSLTYINISADTIAKDEWENLKKEGSKETHLIELMDYFEKCCVEQFSTLRYRALFEKLSKHLKEECLDLPFGKMILRAIHENRKKHYSSDRLLVLNRAIERANYRIFTENLNPEIALRPPEDLGQMMMNITPFTRIPQPMVAYRYLTSMMISNSRIRFIGSRLSSYFPNLTSVSFVANRLIAPPELAALNQLETIDLSDNRITHFPKNSPPTLRHLHLDFNHPDLGDKEPPSKLKKLSRFTFVTLQ